MIRQIQAFTGVSRQYLTDRALRIDDRASGWKSSKRRALRARFDGRITRPATCPRPWKNVAGVYDDASSDRYGAFSSAC